MASFSDLNKTDPALEIIHHVLKALRSPPFRGEVKFSTSYNNPRGRLQFFEQSKFFGDLALTRFQVDVPTKLQRHHRNTESLSQILHKAVDKVVGPLVALVDEGVVAIDVKHLGIRLIERGEVGVVQPKVWRRCTHIGEKMAGMQCMQITYGRCEHYDISGRLEILEQQFAWYNFASAIHTVAHYKLTKNVCHTAELTCNRITTASFARVAVIRSEWLPKIINLRPRPLYVLVLLKCVYSDNVRPIRRPRLWRGRDLSFSTQGCM